MPEYSINILHLYPDLLNLYGDKGNIEALKKRLVWRGIEPCIKECTMENPDFDLKNSDIVLLGGGSEREQMLVLDKLLEKKSEISEYVENNGTVLALCGGFELLGKTIIFENESHQGLGVLDISTDLSLSKKRLIGNVVIELDNGDRVVGFENHGGRIDIGNHTPMGKVLKGFGNNGESGFEGVLYKNVFASYLHGPLLPKNPKLCDKILLSALCRKYGDFTELSPLNDDLEERANSYMIDRIL